MKRLLLLALCSGTYCEAFAKDSDWKICKGEVVMFEDTMKLVVSSYEHRNGEKRAADFTFIYGGNVLHGSLDTTDSNTGPVKLKGYSSSFKGLATMDFQKEVLTLNGKVNLNQNISDLTASLECETL